MVSNSPATIHFHRENTVPYAGVAPAGPGFQPLGRLYSRPGRASPSVNRWAGRRRSQVGRARSPPALAVVRSTACTLTRCLPHARHFSRFYSSYCLTSTGPAQAEHAGYPAIASARCRPRLQPTDYRTANMAAITVWEHPAGRRGSGLFGWPSWTCWPAGQYQTGHEFPIYSGAVFGESYLWVGGVRSDSTLVSSLDHHTTLVVNGVSLRARAHQSQSFHVPALAYSRRLWDYRPERQRRLVRRHHRTLR